MRRGAQWIETIVSIACFAVVAASVLLLDGCIYDASPLERGSIRDPEREIGIAGREGLAFSRLATSPAVLPIYFYKCYDYFGGGRPFMILKTDPVSLTLTGVLMTALASPFIICEEVVVSVPEILTTAQFKRAYYPWETYVGNKRGRRYEDDLNDPELERIKAEANAQLAQNAADVAVKTIEIAGEVVEEAVASTIEESITGSSGAGGVSGGEEDGGGFGTIKGASSLKSGNTSVYKLYVGGKLISDGVDWSAGGTSITVNNNGSYARVMAGNPPIKSGRYKTAVRATYKGRSFTKSISIIK